MTKSKRRGPQKGTPAQDRVRLKRWFGELEVVEAKKELRVQPNDLDIASAIQGDPRNCVFSRACQRQWGSTFVVFFGTVAYLDLLGPDGVRRIERFVLSRAAKRFIKAFDAGETMDPRGFSLLPPSRSQTADEITRQTSRRKHEAILKGKSTVTGAARPKREPTGLRLSAFFRGGMGMVQFPSVQAKPDGSTADRATTLPN